MKICERCGKEYDEDMTFCPYCGLQPDERQKNGEEDKELQMTADENVNEQEDLAAALAAAKAAGALEQVKKENSPKEEVAASVDEEEEEIPKSKLPKILGITVIVLMLAIIASVVVIYFVNQNEKEPVKLVENYLNGYRDKDINKILDTYPDFRTELYTKQAKPEEIWDSWDKSYTEMFGKDWKATYTLGQSKEMTSSDLSDVNKFIEQSYNEKTSISKGYWVDAQLEFSGSQNKQALPLEFAVVEMDDAWYIVYEGTASSASDSQQSQQQDTQQEGTTAAQ